MAPLTFLVVEWGDWGSCVLECEPPPAEFIATTAEVD
jgi:hypothetical protein